ncbi:hypothetical protein [Streptomyces sp. SID4982]|uniref:hypothetical protein n=1 Tax=Streptomyces sp. SID4982 TaxID=2690291 RepID=UPI00136CAAB3|nr:hypothetical protein [Streptomyces sp. SID4982]MYS16596.1 hypothetical protein [Streptomyces sp. SID4982]
MTQPPTDQQLDEIEDRTNAATPGPWEFVTDDHGSHGIETSIWSEGTHRYVAETVTGMSPADGGFTAHAREDVRTLLAEVRRLRAELARRVQCNDCGAIGEVFTADDGRAYLDPSGQIWHGPTASRP